MYVCIMLKWSILKVLCLDIFVSLEAMIKSSLISWKLFVSHTKFASLVNIHYNFDELWHVHDLLIIVYLMEDFHFP
jgi:hypothetical protein